MTVLCNDPVSDIQLLITTINGSIPGMFRFLFSVGFVQIGGSLFGMTIIKKKEMKH